MNTTELIRAEALVARYPVATLQTASGTIAYREAGTGKALVLLHGIGNQSGAWTQQLDALSKQFRVIAWDAPGYGGSDALEADWPLAADYATALKVLLDGLGVGRAVLVGNSLGALMATRFAAVWPDRVAGLVLLNPAGGYGLADAADREAKLKARLERIVRLGPEGMARELPPGMLSADASPDAQALARWCQSKIRIDGYTQAARMLAHGRLVDDAARYPGPVIVVAASADTITPAKSCERIAQSFPRATFRVLAGSGHLSYLEAPAIVNALIAECAVNCLQEAAA